MDAATLGLMLVLVIILAALVPVFQDPAWVRDAIMSRYAGRAPRVADVQDRPDSAGSERENERPNAGSEAFIPDRTPGTAGSAFSLDPSELEAIRLVITYRDSCMQRGAAPTKSGAILAGWSLKRGGSERYVRASLIYDTLFGTPEPAILYPTLASRQLERFEPVD